MQLQNMSGQSNSLGTVREDEIKQRRKVYQ